MLQAAIAAGRAGDADGALAMLQQSLALQHANPYGHYLLGAQYAQRERYGDAVLHLSTAVEQMPGLAEARLQLGLLWLTLRNPASAISQLQPLLQLPEDVAMHHCGQGLIPLAGDELAAAHVALSRGIAIGCDNAALIEDMRKLLRGIEAAQPAATVAASLSTRPELLASVQHDLAISAYKGADWGG